jgi:hypothetical protein
MRPLRLIAYWLAWKVLDGITDGIARVWRLIRKGA